VRQVHRKEVDLAFDTANHTERFSEVDLGMPGWVRQWHKHLPTALLLQTDVVPHNRDAAGKPVLVTQPFEDPLRRMTLLPGTNAIVRQNLVDDSDKRTELRASDRGCALVARREVVPIRWTV